MNCLTCTVDKKDRGPGTLLLSIATKIVPAGPVRGILQGGHQVFSTILMYTEKRGRGTILVAIESMILQVVLSIATKIVPGRVCPRTRQHLHARACGFFSREKIQ